MQEQITPGDRASKLPVAADLAPDVLLMIADLAVNSNARYSGIVDLTHVCRHWRHTFLSFPGFWTNIQLPYENIGFLDALLLRSADCPLRISIKLDDPLHEIYPACDRISLHVHHILDVHIEESKIGDYREQQHCFDYITRSLFNKPLPMLTDMVLVCPGLHIPKNFLEEVAPNLATLEIHGPTLISYQMPIFRTVTRLHLRGVQGIYSVDELFDILKSTSRNLKSLAVDIHEEFPLADFDAHERSTIQFPSLQHLSLILHFDTLMVILDHIIIPSIPSDIDWNICYNCQPNSHNVDITPLLSFLRHVRTGAYLTLHWVEQKSFRLDFKQSFHGPHYRSLSIWFSERPETDFIYPLRAIFAALHLSEVRHCQINSCREGENELIKNYYETFGSLFLPFYDLETLAIWSDKCEALDLFTAQLQPAPTSPCTQLNTLTIRLHPTTGDTKLIQVLKDRREAGLFLKNLHVNIDPHSEVEEEHSIQERLEDLAEISTVIAKNLCPYPWIDD